MCVRDHVRAIPQPLHSRQLIGATLQAATAAISVISRILDHKTHKGERSIYAPSKTIHNRRQKVGASFDVAASVGRESSMPCCVCTGTFIYNLKWRPRALIRYGGDLGVLAGLGQDTSRAVCYCTEVSSKERWS